MNIFQFSGCQSRSWKRFVPIPLLTPFDVSQAEAELGDVQQQLAEVSNNYNSVSTIRRKLEEEVASLHVDLDEMLNEARNSEEKAKKAMIDAARWAPMPEQRREGVAERKTWGQAPGVGWRLVYGLSIIYVPTKNRFCGLP